MQILTPPAVDLDAIFKAYDIRGVVPDELDATIAHRIGRGPGMQAQAVIEDPKIRVDFPFAARLDPRRRPLRPPPTRRRSSCSQG